MTQGGPLSISAPKVTRREALSVPAVLRARNMICATLGTLPLHVHGPDRAIRPSRLLDQPERNVPRAVTLTQLFEDLLFDGIAWWQVVQLGYDGFPSEVRRLDPSVVHEDPDGRRYVNGQFVPDSELICFPSTNPGLLEVGARAIRTCLKLDAAAARYADEPIPPGYATPKTEEEPSQEEVDNWLISWNKARGSRATGYVPARLDYKTVVVTAEQMQLAESRQHAVLEIARATGIDAEDLGVSTTSRTYANEEQRRKALLDFTLGHYVSAVQERLSMPDVTPRGSYVRVSFEGFLRTDAATRMDVYKTAIEVGAIAKDEIRALEDKPELTPAQKRDAKPAPAPIPQGAPVQQVQNSAESGDLMSFTSAGDVVSLTFSPSDLEEFKADPEKRTVSGMLLPFNVQTADDRSIRFAAGSVTWDKSAVSRVKLDREHDLGQLLGSATKVASSESGISASFKVARTPAGDEALALAADGALDGLSAVVRIKDAIPDPVNEGGTLVTAAHLVRATLTADPAFDDARLTAVALTKEGNTAMTDATTGQTAPADVPDHAAFTSAVTSFTEAVERFGSAREVVSAGRAVVTREEPVYQFGAAGMRGHSFVRDAFTAKTERSAQADEASARLAKFAAQMQDQQFATVNRTVGVNVIPPGYRPDLYQPQLFQGRPLMSMVSQGTLTDSTPFTLPTFTSATGGTADHTEGTNPTDGSLVIGTRTVTPGAISGLFKVTREVIDASNPAIDAIALQAMQESYAQQTEGKVYTELNGSNGQGGTITSGAVPSGVTAIAVTGVGATGAAGATLIDTLRDQIVAYPFRRFAAPNRLALSAEAAQQLAKAKDGQGRPLLPRIGATNATGGVSTLDQAFDVDGLAGVPAWSMTGNAAGDADTLLWNSADVWAWESPTLNFRYEERSGPALVELALFGYFAVRILRPGGFSSIRLTVT
jgi:HK97 family phage major capsid protein